MVIYSEDSRAEEKDEEKVSQYLETVALSEIRGERQDPQAAGAFAVTRVGSIPYSTNRHAFTCFCDH